MIFFFNQALASLSVQVSGHIQSLLRVTGHESLPLLSVSFFLSAHVLGSHVDIRYGNGK